MKNKKNRKLTSKEKEEIRLMRLAVKAVLKEDKKLFEELAKH